MKKEQRIRVIIFGGTSEGRELAEYAAKYRIPALVSVVSEYGEHLLEEHSSVQVRKGALDREGMKKLLEEKKPELVLDATHPYAVEVTGHLSEVCLEAGIGYKRVLRCQGSVPTGKNDSQVYYVPSAEDAVELLRQDSLPVFLTTGSKELEQFVSASHLQERIYARVLPDSRVLEHCEALGIRGKHLIAMQGPFSAELNEAMLRQTGAGWLVTKESGGRGGFAEKLEAAGRCGIRTVVIGRPSQERGLTLEEAVGLLKGFRPRRLVLIGMGMGGGRQLTLEAAEELGQCDAVFGAPRMIQDVAEQTKQAVKVPVYQPEKILDWLRQNKTCRSAAVVYSGDTGFYSGCQSLLRAVEQAEAEWTDMETQVYPGISSVSALCGRLQIPWENLYLASAHGRVCDIAALIRTHRQVFLLLEGTSGLREACGALVKQGLGAVQVDAGIRMGYRDEELLSGTAGEFQNRETPGLTAAVFTRSKEASRKERMGDLE